MTDVVVGRVLVVEDVVESVRVVVGKRVDGDWVVGRDATELDGAAVVPEKSHPQFLVDPRHFQTPGTQ